MSFGLYVHYPFCERKCPYCDFVSFADELALSGRESYFRLLLRELDLWHEALPHEALQSIYLGGGTPSLAHPEAIAEVIHGITSRLVVAPGCEITLEANPHSADIARFRDFRAAGVNRLSIGVQSFQDKTLKALGRLHSAEQARQALQAAREASFDNLSADLIFGIPRQTQHEFQADLNALLEFRPEHASVYGLTLYEGTEFHRRHEAGRLRLPSDDMQAAMFLTARHTLQASGYQHYEISNYALPGRRSRHNRLYWTGGEWLGLGVSAHSSIGGRRWENPVLLEEWAASIERGELAARPETMPQGQAAVGEAVMLGLRQSEGVSLGALRARFGEEVEEEARRRFEPLVAEGLAEASGERMVLTERGLLVADAVMGRFF